jgi:hypothetical protein
MGIEFKEVPYDGRSGRLTRLVVRMERKGWQFVGTAKPGILARPRARFIRSTAR